MDFNSIAFRLNLLVMIIITSILIGFGVVDYYQTKATVLERIRGEANLATDRLYTTLPRAIWSFDDTMVDVVSA